MPCPRAGSTILSTTRILAPGQPPETGTPPLRKACLALYVQSAVALLCGALLFGDGSVHTVFAVVACVAALGNVLLAVRLPAQRRECGGWRCGCPGG
jgi:hypothetical protein